MERLTNYSAPDRQREIYVKGVQGKLPIVPFDFKQLAEKAKTKMSKKAYAYVAGGAGKELTMANNRKGFEQWKIVPRMLRDVSERDLSIELFGQPLPSPFLTCPIGVLEMAHQEADLAVAKATASMGIPMIFSNQASVPMEQCAAVMGNSPRWFQLYWSKSNELVASLVKRAEKAGCSAITVTLDTTLLGWRTRDLDVAYLPFLYGKGIAQYTSDPVFLKLLETFEPENPPKRKITWNSIRTLIALLSNYPGGFLKNLGSDKPLKAVQQFISIYSRPSLTWDDLAFLREQTKLPILLKGILHPDDAQKALDYGMDGLIVSNHGGRQVDGAVGAIECLPSIVDVVNDQVPVLLDSGIRTGGDVFKALALGAKAVCIGRPYVYGLAIAGALGVQEILKNFLADLELTMALAGCKSIAEINRDMLVTVA
ncbi:MAG: lactate 2-monooxygenase [Flammeovirgaceae bacterium]